MKKFSGLIATSVLASLGADTAFAADILAARTIRAGEIIGAADLITPEDRNALRRAVDIVGMETSRAVYQGQPIKNGELKKPTLIKRNGVVHMEYRHGPMQISAEGRALDAGGLGDRIRVMNLGSKRIVTVVVTGADSVRAH